MEDKRALRQRYSLVLSNICTARRTTSADMRFLTTHLPDGRGADSINTTTGVALPPTTVKGAYWWLRTVYGNLALSAMRLPTSYRYQNPFHARGTTQADRPPYLREALTFANNNWGVYLQDDTYPSAALIVLMLPNNDIAGTQYAWLNSPSRAILATGQQRVTRVFSSALVGLTSLAAYGLERCGSSPERFEYCASCGHYIDGTTCAGCRTKFQPRQQSPRAKPIAMPETVIQGFAGIGHCFTRDPRIWIAC